MNVLITGATGFIGKNLSLKLFEKGYNIYALTRNPHKKFNEKIKFVLWDGKEIKEKIGENLYGIINLVGENIFSLLYTENKKKKIIESRINSIRAIYEFIKRENLKPEVFIQASAIGYYGNSYDEKNEYSPPGKGFLSKVCIEWEKESEKIEEMGIRRCVIRMGIVLGKGGFLSKFSPFLKTPFLPFIGKKENYISFIHIEDLINGIIFLLENKGSRGIYNFVSPNYLKMKEFYEIFAKVLNKKLIKIPNFIFKILMGEMNEEIIFFNNRVIPEKLLKENFNFQFPDLEISLKNIFCNYTI